MAFGFGNTVNPQLGATNYSGYLQGALSGAQMQAQGGAAIGQGIAQGLQNFAQGIEKYQKKKEEKETKQANVNLAADMIRENRGLFPGLDPDTPEGMEKIRAGTLAAGPAAFLQMRQTLSKAKEDQDAAAYAGQLSQGTGMDYLRGNFMSPFRSTPVSPAARQRGEDLNLEREYRRAQLADLTATTASRLKPSQEEQNRQSDRLVSEVTDELVAQINSGIRMADLAPGFRGANEPQVTSSIFNRALNNPAVKEALDKKELRDGEDALASAIDNVRVGVSVDKAIADVPVRFRSAFLSETRKQFPEKTDVRPMIVNGKTIGHIVGVQFFPVTTPAMDPDSYTRASNGMKDIALRFKDTEYDALPSQIRQDFDRLALQHASATGMERLADPYEYINDLYDTSQEIASAVEDSVSSKNQQGGGDAPAQPMGQPGMPPTGQPRAQVTGGSGSPFINPPTQRMGQQPLGVRMVTPISDVGPVTDPVTGKVIGAIGPRLEPTPENGVFQTGTTALPPGANFPAGDARQATDLDEVNQKLAALQGGDFPMERKVSLGAGAAYAAYKAAPAAKKTMRAATVLTRRYGPSVGNAVKTLGRFGKALANRVVPPVAISMFANEAIGHMITFAANTAAKKSGSDLIDYNKGASEWLAESLAKSIYGPNSEQEITSRILDELSVVKNSDDLTDAEKQKSNAFLLELLNNVRSGDVSGVPERFRAL